MSKNDIANILVGVLIFVVTPLVLSFYSFSDHGAFHPMTIVLWAVACISAIVVTHTSLNLIDNHHKHRK